MPSNNADAIAKKVLIFLALGLAPFHGATRWWMVLIPFMIAVLYVPLNESVDIPNWVRYLAYFSMFAVYVAAYAVASK